MTTNNLVNDYETFSRKLIYIIEANNASGNWPAYNGSVKVGDASIDNLGNDLSPNSSYLREAADKRVKSYMGTSGVPYILDWAEFAYRSKFKPNWFRDHEIHKVLENSNIKHNQELNKIGQEWFMTDAGTAKQAIRAYINGKESINANKQSIEDEIKLRPEQKEAVLKTRNAFKKKKNDKMLWNAKMRFGKTLTALELIKEEKYKKVLIITHRPIVNGSWYEDFNKIKMPSAGYTYGSKQKGENIEYLYKLNEPFVYFASLQDLGGSKLFNNKGIDKNELLAKIDWDLIIIDEAHEGTQTDLSQKVLKKVKHNNTKLLELSGTPFNILDQYDENQVFTWDYVMEQEAKQNWSKNNGDTPNPYIVLPKVSMYTFEMKDKFNNDCFIDSYNKSFNFKEFFKVDSNGNFIYKNKVNHFLDNITSQNNRTNYPYSTKEFRSNLRHTLWILPGIKEAKALEHLMINHPIFGKEYKIINIVDDGNTDDTINSENDVDRVNKAISDKPYETKTITLTVRKLTTGVTIKPWTGVLFLSNTNSSMQYLQAAFRAQTPYSDASGMKTNCYIFDFAPDRALTVMAGTSKLSTGAGKLSPKNSEKQMSHLLNFLPIIGEENQQMKMFNVDSLLSKLKRVYAEKAVRTGFDDDSIYNDELLKLDNVDLKEFNNLKEIVGTTKAEKKPVKIDINSQGLTDEEYEQAINGQNKRKKIRSKEEQESINKMNVLKKQRRTTISILRSISIRIPLMIYGLDVPIKKDVDVYTFVEKIDDSSWREFMPDGVTKELFKKFSKYYDSQIFIEAGRIIRQKVKSLDKLEPIERAKGIAEIFFTFKNPDKETVLTPWNVINKQLGKTIGGYSTFDNEFIYSSNNGKNVDHWINTDLTNMAFNDDCHILEINSKTGLYPLYVAMSLYWKKWNKMNNETAGKFSFEDEMDIWKSILKNNIFAIAKTPMAKRIAQRTLTGFNDFDINILFIEDLIKKAENNIVSCVKSIKERFDNMKFDLVIGNPPYQKKVKKADGNERMEPLYHLFMQLSIELAPVVTLITPARFLFDAGATPSSWNKKMLNDKHLKLIDYERDSYKIFPRTEIKGGIAITLYNSEKEYSPIEILTPYKQLTGIVKNVLNKDFIGLDTIISSRGMYKFSGKLFEDYSKESEKLSNNSILSNSFDKIPDAYVSNPKNKEDYCSIVGRLNNSRIIKYIPKIYVEPNKYINTYNVCLPEANGTGSFGEKLSSPFVLPVGAGVTDTFISIGSFNNIDEANNLLIYIKSKFARCLLYTKKVTQHGAKNVWKLVPIQNFSNSSDIDWNINVDQQLYKKYNFTDKEIKFIENNVKEME